MKIVEGMCDALGFDGMERFNAEEISRLFWEKQEEGI
jgi:hypothetical protein